MTLDRTILLLRMRGPKPNMQQKLEFVIRSKVPPCHKKTSKKSENEVIPVPIVLSPGPTMNAKLRSIIGVTLLPNHSTSP